MKPCRSVNLARSLFSHINRAGRGAGAWEGGLSWGEGGTTRQTCRSSVNGNAHVARRPLHGFHSSFDGSAVQIWQLGRSNLLRASPRTMKGKDKVGFRQVLLAGTSRKSVLPPLHQHRQGSEGACQENPPPPASPGVAPR